jgi:hypothetical protein
MNVRGPIANPVSPIGGTDTASYVVSGNSNDSARAAPPFSASIRYQVYTASGTQVSDPRRCELTGMTRRTGWGRALHLTNPRENPLRFDVGRALSMLTTY